MAMSFHQRRIVRLMHENFQLRLVRSLIDNAPVYAELFKPGASPAERIPMWRVQKLLVTGAVSPDSGDIATAAQIVLTHRYCQSACRRPPAEEVRPGEK